MDKTNQKTILTNCFQNVISLGFFCSISLDLEKMGLRSFSGPFDWVISDNFRDVINLIDNHFEHFIEEDLLEQNIDNPYLYRNTANGIRFYHDFDGYIPLHKQFEKVKEKYERRIKRFYEKVCKPSLFIRYITDSVLCSDEIDYILNNYEEILGILKRFNEQNELIVISHYANDRLFKLPHIFYVEKDAGDSVNRNPLFSNDELTSLLDAISTVDREKNKSFSSNKKKRKYSIKRFFCKPYKHNKRY